MRSQLPRLSLFPPVVSVLLLAFVPVAHARQGAPPFSRNGAGGALGSVERVLLPPIDREAATAEADRRSREEGLPFQFAEPVQVSITPQTHGTWERLPDGGRLWRVRIEAPGSTDINLGFSRYQLPAGASLHVISEVRDYYEGPYTYEDNKPHGQLWLPVVPGEGVVVELYVPEFVKFEPELELAQVGCGFRDWFKLQDPILRQGSCNNDVICPEGDPWRDDIASVAVYSLNGYMTCTGQMLMNTAADFKAYFLTANHCGISSSNDASMVVYWNFESPTCGALCCGSLADNQTGATLVAKRSDSDFCLVELDAQPDPNFGVYWAGWDNSGSTPANLTGIHHPGTDEKAISFDYDPPTVTSYLGTSVPGDGTHWRVGAWDDGTTEPGSSGSGLWDQNHHLVGQLHGGYASCSAQNQSDWYGRFAMSWDGSSASTRLRDWLDPGNTGATTLDGSFAAATLSYVSHSGVDDCPSDPANVNGIWEPGESIVVAVTIRASGDHQNISGTLSTTTTGVTIVDDTATWPNLTSGNQATSDAPHFLIQLSETIPCNSTIDFQLSVTSDQGGPFPMSFSHSVGEQLVPPGLPMAIPDGDPNGVTSTLSVSQNVTLSDLDVLVQITHTWVGDLKIQLEGPSGARITLLDRPGVPGSTYGCSDNDMDITFDDASGFDPENHCAGTTPWYSGVASPVQALSVFNGLPSQGTWKLIVSDHAGADTGSIDHWELVATPALTGTCNVCASATGSPIAGLGTRARFQLAQNRPNPFTGHSEISFTLARNEHTTLEVFDVTGRLVRTLVRGRMGAGAHAVTWDGTDSSNHPVATGIYFYRLTSGSDVAVKRMNLMR